MSYVIALSFLSFQLLVDKYCTLHFIALVENTYLVINSKALNHNQRSFFL